MYQLAKELNRYQAISVLVLTRAVILFPSLWLPFRWIRKRIQLPNWSTSISCFIEEGREYAPASSAPAGVCSRGSTVVGRPTENRSERCWVVLWA